MFSPVGRKSAFYEIDRERSFVRGHVGIPHLCYSEPLRTPCVGEQARRPPLRQASDKLEPTRLTFDELDIGNDDD
jgi:hypothetical protein